MFVGLGIVSHLSMTSEVGAKAQFDSRALIVHRTEAIGTYQSALSVDAVERSLWTTQDIGARQLIVVIVVCALAHQWQPVGIDAHSRTVDA